MASKVEANYQKNIWPSIKMIMKYFLKTFSSFRWFKNLRAFCNSCVLQLLDVLDDWSKYYDESKQIDNIYLDIKKAFDTISHDRLLLKLKRYGFDGQLLNWVKDFLSGRKQRVERIILWRKIGIIEIAYNAL